MKLNKHQLDLHDKMAERLTEIKEEFFKKPEIYSIGISLKLVNNNLENTLCYTFGVKENLTLSQIQDQIPKTLYGFPTDLIEFKVQNKRLASDKTKIEASRNEKTNPLIGGISISANSELEHGGKEVTGSGTLGVMVNKRGDDKPYLITCAHVLAGAKTKIDSDVCQQSKWETTLNYCHNCAELKSYFYENVSFERNSISTTAWLDCAIARKGYFRSVTIGKVYEVDAIIGGFGVISPAIIGKEVSKSGITTGISSGTITSITTSLRLEKFDGTKVIAQNLIMVRGKSGRFSEPGDSGSAVFTTDDSLMVGILGGSTVSGDQSFVVAADAILSKWPELSFTI